MCVKTCKEEKMDVNTDFIWRVKLEKLVKKLQENQMDAFIVDSKEEILLLLDSLLKPGSTVNAGGSMTLQETGILDYLRKGDFIFFDRNNPDVKSGEEIKAIYRQAFSADYYFASTNAITADGWLYNVDGRGNRVAAMIYGPENVIIVCGRNKWVKDLDAAIERNREIAAPGNCVRLSKKTPCALSGSCEDCKSPDRICNEFTIIKRNLPKGRIKVILLNFEAGY